MWRPLLCEAPGFVHPILEVGAEHELRQRGPPGRKTEVRSREAEEASFCSTEEDAKFREAFLGQRREELGLVSEVLVRRARRHPAATRDLFEHLNRGDFDYILRQFAPNAEHWFSGQHALSGLRRTPELRGKWYERLRTVFPGIRFDVQ